MNTIKFSHDYSKFPLNWEETEALLIGVMCNNLQMIREKFPLFLDNDARFRGEEGNYNLDFDEAIILTFVHIKTGQLFTTIRRYTPSKAEYYRSEVGEIFRMVKTNGDM
jgi:hypothetical protein